jgi:photosystem II stability/assembly factor-like uncharacterized protein
MKPSMLSILVSVPLVVGITGCASTSGLEPSAPSSGSSAATSAPPSPSSASVMSAVSGSELGEHVHNLAFDGSTLLLGTHEGLWSQSPGQVPVQISQRPFDVMGFAKTESRWLASGHPARGEDGPADLGLLESLDRGVTWQEVSLSGEADFHRLTVSGDRIFGVSSVDDALLRSDDAGATWINLGSLGLFDIAIDPANPDTLIATTADGLVRSTDAGATFSPVPTPSLIALLAWTPNYVVGADVDGKILTSVDDGSTWEALTTLPEQPAALGADGSRIAVLAGPTVYESVDGGKTFTERITEISGH